jgi:hypothetical protein
LNWRFFEEAKLQKHISRPSESDHATDSIVVAIDLAIFAA